MNSLNFDIAVRVIVVSAVAVSIMKIFGNKGILVTLTLIGVFLLVLYLFQNKMLYMPTIPNSPLSPKENPPSYRHPSQHGIETVDVEIATADNLRIRGWLLRSQTTQRILVYFHQNAGNLGIRIPFIRHLHQRTNSDILLVAYRGYSDSEGTPTEEGLQIDGQAILSYAIDYQATELAQGRTKDIFLLGRSLGGAVSIYMATLQGFKDKIKGLILENTFTSIQQMVKILFPPLAHLQFLHRNFWPSRERIGKVRLPILFVRSLRDQIVPTQQMLQLMVSADNAQIVEEHKILAGTHNVAWQVDPPAYFGRLQEFFSKVK